MTKIADRQAVRAPLGSAHRLLQRYLDAHPGPDGAARLVLHAAGLEQAANVSVTPADRPQDMEPRYHVRWEAEADGPFPVFEGILAIGGADDYHEFDLLLDGAYEPPMGLVGKTFDLVVGNRLANETVRTLLGDIQRDIESSFAAEEAAKR